MKSVVVEASTVARAIESAWQKAEKPEEFFIRILQEHSSGFLGFGAQKAKIVFFFKNAQKSDSLFPVVLKQKEYASLFSNDKLKAPAQLNVIDNELNKNISLAQKKKQHPASQMKHKQNPNQAARPAHQEAKPSQNQHQNVPAKHPQQQRPQQQNNKTQVKLELPVKPVVKHEQPVKKDDVIKKVIVQAPKVPQIPKAVAPNLKSVVAQQVKEVVQTATPQVTPVAASAPRVIQKMKRRPLTGADQGVSGITKSEKTEIK